MYIILLMLFTVVAGFYIVHRIDQQRWDRYQFDRAKFFLLNPYYFYSNHTFEISIYMNAFTQTKLVNALMLNPNNSIIYKNVTIQRFSGQQINQYEIKVIIENIAVGYLEKNYAKQFVRCLEHTDFFVGRPIEVFAEISLVDRHGKSGCIVKLDLCSDPFLAKDYVFEKKAGTKHIK